MAACTADGRPRDHQQEDYAFAKKKIHAKRIEYVPGVGVDTAKFHVGTVDRAEKRRELGLTEQDFLILTVAEMTKTRTILRCSRRWRC